MTIVIKELRVKTTVENKAADAALSKEQIETLKRSILKEISDSATYTRYKQPIKDR